MPKSVLSLSDVPDYSVIRLYRSDIFDFSTNGVVWFAGWSQWRWFGVAFRKQGSQPGEKVKDHPTWDSARNEILDIDRIMILAGDCALSRCWPNYEDGGHNTKHADESLEFSANTKSSDISAEVWLCHLTAQCCLALHLMQLYHPRYLLTYSGMLKVYVYSLTTFSKSCHQKEQNNYLGIKAIQDSYILWVSIK